MAKKGSSMKSFKKLFSRSEASLNESVEKEKKEGEKKKFKFPTLRTKSKSGSEKSLNGSQQVLSDVESSNDGEAWTNNGARKNKRFSLYGTAPRAKDKDISYSEMDLRKPKRFATFSFGFKKKKKKDEEMSKSTFGLHTHGIEEQEEDLGQMKLDQTNTKRFSMSEPELDTSGAFDIPSPPPVANNLSESYFTLTGQSQTASQERPTNGFDVHQEPLQAPIAAIPEAQLDDPDPSDKKENVPNDFKATATNPEIPPEVNNQSVPGLPPASASSASSHLPDVDVQLKDESTVQPDAPESADESSLAYLESQNNPNVTDSPPQDHKSHLDSNIAASEAEVSLSDRVSAIPERATASAPSAAPVSPEMVYGALYDTLFPQNFNAEVLSSFSKSPSKVRTETHHPGTETVIFKTMECRPESDATDSRTTAARESDSDDTVDGFAKALQTNSRQIYSEMTHPATNKEIVMIKTFSERHSESILHSNESESAGRRAKGEEPVEARSPDGQKSVMVKTLNEIGAESNVIYSSKSTSHEPGNTIGVDDGVGRFVTVRKKVTEVSACPEMSPPDTKKAIMVKTLYGPNSDAETVNSDSFDRGMDNTTQGFSSLYDQTVEETYREGKKPAIMIKTRNEIHTESSIILSPKAASGQLDWTDGKMEETMEKYNLPQIVSEIGLDSEKPVMVKTLDENQTETNATHETGSIIPSVENSGDSLESAETSSAHDSTLLRDKEMLEPEPIVVKIPETKPEPIVVEPSRMWTSDLSDSSASGKSADASSAQILTDVRYTEINNEPHDENPTEDNVLHSQASSSHRSEENKMKTVDFPSVSQNSMETLNILTEMEKPDVVKTFNEINTEGNTAESDSVYGKHDIINSFVSVTDESVVSCELERNLESHDGDSSDSCSQPVDSSCIPQSEPSHSYSEMKSDLAPDSSGSVPVSRSTAPPITDCATSQWTATRVTDTERREILPEQLVGDGASADARSPSPVKGVLLKIRTESFSDRPGNMDWIERSMSPSYLSIGSEDGAALELYYSAEEGDEGESGDEPFTADTRPESVSTGGRDAGRKGEAEGGGQVLTVEMGPAGDERSPEETHQERDEGGVGVAAFSETGTKQLLVGSDAASLEEKGAAAADLKKEGEEVRKEELPAIPVQQVNTRMVCDFAPPGEEEEEEAKCSVNLETEDQTPAVKQLPCLEGQNQAYRGNRSPACTDATSSDNQSERDTITSTEAQEQVSLCAQADTSEGVRGESTESSGGAIKAVRAESPGAAEVVTGNVTHGAELQSDAAPAEHNRAPPSSEWADPISHSNDTRAEVAVEPSEPNADTRRPDTEAADAVQETQERPAETRRDLDEGLLTASATPESPPTESETDSVTTMNSGYSSLSTKLSLRTSTLPKEDESKLRIHKVSLIKEDDAANVGRDTVDFSGTDSAVTESIEDDFSSGYKWENRLEGVGQYVPKITENSTSSESLSYRISESSSSNYPSSYSSSYSFTLPEATAYKHLSDVASSFPEEHSTLGSHLTDRTVVYLRRESELAEQPWRRSLLAQEEPDAPAQREGESEIIKSGWDSQQLPAFSFSSAQPASYSVREEDEDDASRFTGVFKATLIQLVPEPAAPSSTPPASPEDDSSSHSDMESLVDTLKNMGPSMRPRGMALRPPVPALMSSLPPIVEDATSPVVADVPDSSGSPTKQMRPTNPPAELSNGEFMLPTDLGLRKNARDLRSPLTLMKQGQDQQQQQPGARNLSLHLRSTTNSIATKSSDSPTDEAQSPVHNGNGVSSSSRLDNSVLFRSYRSSSIDQALDNGVSHRPLLRTGSLPDTGPVSNRLSAGPKELGEPRVSADILGSRSERLSFLLNAASSSTGSLPGSDDLNNRISRPSTMGANSSPATNTAARVLTTSSSLDLPRPLTNIDTALSKFGQTPGIGGGTGTSVPPLLQRSFSSDGQAGTQSSMFSNISNQFQSPGSQFQSPGSQFLSPGSQFQSPGSQFQSPGSQFQSPGSQFQSPGSQFQSPGSQFQSQGSQFQSQGSQFQSQGSQFQSQGSQFQSQGSQFQSQGSQFQSQGSQFQSQEPDRNIVSKYRAFPDAYLTKEKEHGKLNPRPGKMYIFDRPGMCGQRLEIRSDIVDATSWELQDTISIRVIRGGWVLYEKPNFKGEKVALDEGDIELTCPFSPLEEQQNEQSEAEQQQQNEQSEAEQQQQNGEKSETKPARRFIIGSIRRAVRDYSVPDISLFPEENAEGKKVIFRDTSEDARIFGFPIKANSIIINAGLWLVYAQPFFQGVPRVLEVGGYPNPAAWGVEQPYVGSLHPLKVGEPRVENLSEPKIVIYDKPYFSGKSRTINATMRDFMARVDRQQTAFMYSVGSLKVLGGIWVGYEKEGFRGHQYLLEEGEFHDWRVWGGCNSELRSVRVIRADLTDPLMVMFEQPEEDQEGMPEENTFEVTEAIPDVELFEYKTSTRSIHVLSGAWIAYSHVDFSGNQYILEKGFYNNCADWGSADTRICSVQPILLAPSDSLKCKDEILLYSEPDYQGECHIFNLNQEALPDKLAAKSCRVARGSWVLYENTQFAGAMFVLSEGDYPNLTSMGCLLDSSIRSIKVVPMKFSVPSISLFGLEGLEGREITTEHEIVSMVEEGFNNHILSVRVNNGCWVICEHSNYRGRQFLLEPIEITNWEKFSSLNTVGSMYPVRQKRHWFRVKNKETGNYLSVQGGVEEMKSGRVVAAPQLEPMSDIWYYQDGLLKNKLAPNMALQVMGNVEAAAKVVLWTETRQPIQTWAAQIAGLITSITFSGFVLDVKGGKSYDKDHVVVMPESDERPSQQWKIELL